VCTSKRHRSFQQKLFRAHLFRKRSRVLPLRKREHEEWETLIAISRDAYCCSTSSTYARCLPRTHATHIHTNTHISTNTSKLSDSLMRAHRHRHAHAKDHAHAHTHAHAKHLYKYTTHTNSCLHARTHAHIHIHTTRTRVCTRMHTQPYAHMHHISPHVSYGAMRHSLRCLLWSKV